MFSTSLVRLLLGAILVKFCWHEACGEAKIKLKKGTVPEIDNLILDPFVLKAISFSVNYKDEPYQDVLVDVAQQVRDLSTNLSGSKKEDANYYVYILENVAKFTVKWLSEEVHQFYTMSEDDLKKSASIRRKKKIANFIYDHSLEYGAELVMQDKDISLNGWQKKTPPNHKLEL